MPLPYFRSFVRRFGNVDVAWTRAEVEELIAVTRREKEMAKSLGTGPHQRKNE